MTKGKELAPSSPMEDWGDYAGAGLENPTRDEQITPFLIVLQQGSPQCNPVEGLYNPNARPGMFMNNATSALYDGREIGLECLFVAREHIYTEWAPNRGGFQGTRRIDDPEARQLITTQGKFPRERLRNVGHRALITQTGTELVETIQFAIIYGEPPLARENARPALLACTSIKLSPAKRLFSRLIDMRYHGVQPPMWAHKWLMKTIHEPRPEGDSYNIKFDLCADKHTMEALIPRDSELFSMAAEFYGASRTGGILPDYSNAISTNTDDEIPF